MKLTRRRFLLLASAGAAGAAACYPVFIERNIVLVNRYRIEVPNLPAPFAGFTMAHLTDIHYGTLMSLGKVRRVVRKANSLARDVVVCTGDYVHHWKRNGNIDAVWSVLSELSAPDGVFSVLGNHDHWADAERSLQCLENSGQYLRHRVKVFERDGTRLWLAGAGDLWEDHLDLDRLLAETPENDCRIVLAHNPDTADTGFSTRVDLFISGHTHGGQIRLPFFGAPLLPVENKNYSSGLKLSRRGTQVFISRGIGWAVYPVRFNCYPEIAVLELQPAGVERGPVMANVIFENH